MGVVFKNVRASKPKALISEMQKVTKIELEKTLEKSKKELIDIYKNIVKDWEHKPDFAARKFIQTNQLKVEVFPTGPNREIWIYVDKGTKPHSITGSPKLAFNWGGPGSYKSKTLARPARTVSGGGTVQGGVQTFAKKVQHPGIEAREFEVVIIKDYQPRFRRDMENTYKRIARKLEE